VTTSVDLTAELAEFIKAPSNNNHYLQNHYSELADVIQNSIAHRVNRLLDYARAIKRQFRLPTIETSENPGQFFLRHGARCAIDGVDVRFDPDRTITIRVTMNSDPETMIRQEDWETVRGFVVGNRRTPLIEELIANARSLANNGHRRNALVEVVTALEIALGRYAAKADPRGINRFQGRLEAESIGALVRKVGLRGSFGLAIPLLFTEEEFPLEMLTSCRAAIDQRNNVVHNGARDVDPGDLTVFINRIEASCKILQNPAMPTSDD
jgi:hypothetical protein